MIGAAERKRIEEVVARARKKPLPLSIFRLGLTGKDRLTLEDREAFKRISPDFIQPPSSFVNFPAGYSAAFSFEEQPAGICSHLSVSVRGREKKGMMPSVDAVQMIAQAFGVPFPPGSMWIEEFEPGEFAVNLLSVSAPAAVGHA